MISCTEFLKITKGELLERRNTLFTGLTKLEETNIEVAKLQEELTVMQPNLQKQVEEQNQLSVKLDKDKVEANKKKAVVEEEKKVVTKKANEV
jgi:peptidoglycan hydrolase CwlO-like protein